MSKSIGFYCPHCNVRMHVTSRKRLSELYHSLIVSCRTPDCLASFSASLEIERTIQHSLNPNPDIITGIHDWERNMEHQLSSLELQPDIDLAQKIYVEGLINALFWVRKIDLAKAQQYRQRLLQMKLI